MMSDSCLKPVYVLQISSGSFFRGHINPEVSVVKAVKLYCITSAWIWLKSGWKLHLHQMWLKRIRKKRCCCRWLIDYASNLIFQVNTTITLFKMLKSVKNKTISINPSSTLILSSFRFPIFIRISGVCLKYVWGCVSAGCLEGVCSMSAGCPEGVWEL